MFDRKGLIYLDAESYNEETALEAALEAGADDFQRDGDQYVVTASPTEFHAVLDRLKAKGIDAMEVELAMVPQNTVHVEGKEAEQLLRLIEALEELDDVSRVFSNFDIDAETMAEVSR
jgi:transcriptional/translational regulatory protein YebC/TACO1